MKYIDVTWNHTDSSEPFRLVSELDDESFEIRKLEFFKDGTVGYATKDNNSENTMLGSVEVPPIDKINSDKQFEALEITKDIFENMWTTYRIVQK